MNRRGEKLGWIGGWSGGFIWVLVLSIVLVTQGETLAGSTGLLVVVVAFAAIMATAPWKHPDVPYWKLLLPVYGVFFGALVWAAASFGGLESLGFRWGSAFLLLPLLLPFWIVGKRRWSDVV